MTIYTPNNTQNLFISLDIHPKSSTSPTAAEAAAAAAEAAAAAAAPE